MCGVFDKYRQFFPEVMVKDKIPGLSIAYVDRDGILWAAGFGYTDYDKKTPVTTDTVFVICSTSKTITAVAVMVAVQDGLLELDVPIIEYFPQFTVNSRFEENPHKKITLRHLLSHTSGIASYAPDGNYRVPSYGSWPTHSQTLYFLTLYVLTHQPRPKVKLDIADKRVNNSRNADERNRVRGQRDRDKMPQKEQSMKPIPPTRILLL